MKKSSQIFFTAAVTALLLIVLVFSIILPRQEVRANEVYTAAPSLISGGKLNISFFKDLESYFEKNFAFRHEMITADAAVKSRIFASSGTDSVIMGKDGWLFYSSTTDDYLNIASISERDAADIAISLSLAEEYASKHGAVFMFFVAPNKNTVYPQFMPDRYSPADSDDNCDLLYAALTQRGVSCLDLRSVFCNTEDTIYHRLDSHWNNTGAAIAEREILTALGMESVDRTAVEFEIRYDFSADLYEMAFPSGKMSDEQRYYNLSPITENGTSEDIVYETSSDSVPGSLVMFRDSFGNALAPFLARDFGSAVFSRSVPYDATEIVEAQASALVIELAERNIINLKNRAIIFPAPVRDIDLPKKTVEAEFAASVTESDGLICITGNISLARDSGTPIYAVADGTVYEASPVGDGENAFTLYLENTPSDISLVLTIGGEKYIVHQ